MLVWLSIYGCVSDSLDEFPSNFVHVCDECVYEYTQTGFSDAGGDFLTFSVDDVNNRVTYFLETYHNNYYCQNI